jgi:peroxiredoxin
MMAALRESSSATWRGLYDDLVKRLTESGTTNGSLAKGDRFPEFALPNEHGGFVRSDDLLQRGPLVISFYRGQWCPFCSAAVEAMAAAAPAIRAVGATVIGISPELGNLSFCAGRKHELNFEMLCDVDNGLALQCGLVFRLTDEIVRGYVESGLDLTQVNGNGSWFLPIPASYIVVSNGMIAHSYVNPDFRYRLDPQDILRTLNDIMPA